MSLDFPFELLNCEIGFWFLVFILESALGLFKGNWSVLVKDVSV